MDDQRRQINEQELTYFYSLIGQGIWYLQHVENALNTCLTVKGEIGQPGTVSKDDAEKLLSKHRRNTLGTSLRLAAEKGVLRQELMLALRDFKEERDWLVHRSMNANGDDLYLHSGREAVFERLENFLEQARGLQALIARELEDFVVAQGVPRERIHQIANREISKKRGTDN